MRLMAVMLALPLLAAGCSGPAGTSTPGAADHGALAKTLELGIDAPSNGPSGYNVDVTLHAYDDARSYAFAWSGNLTLQFSVRTDATHYPNCGNDGQSLTFTRAVRPQDFRNDFGAGEHWSLTVKVMEPQLGHGLYTVHATVRLDPSGKTLEADASFNHCG